MKVDVNEKVESDKETSGIESVGEIEKRDRVEKEPLSETKDAAEQLQLITKDENSMESRTETEIESGKAENTSKRPEGESGEIGDGSKEIEEDHCDSNNNAWSEVSPEAETDPQACGDKTESKSGHGGLDKPKSADISLDKSKSGDGGLDKSTSGDGGLDKLHKLEPIWMKR